MCVCVCACVCARARVCVCVCVCRQEGNKEWAIAPKGAQLIVIKLSFWRYGIRDKVGVFSFSRPPSSTTAQNNVEALSVLSRSKCASLATMSEAQIEEQGMS
jgi:hypothetical protein